GTAGHTGAKGLGHSARGMAHPRAGRDRGGRHQGLRRVRHLGHARRGGRQARRHRDRGGSDLPRRGHQVPRLSGHPGRHDPARQLGRVPPGGAEERRRHGGPGDDEGRQDYLPGRHPRRSRHHHGREQGQDPARHRRRHPPRRRHPHGHPDPPRPQPPPV
ncbi:MAG: CBS domain protein sometimes clustered with YjeE, partial [uncultured Rubrobacteraceae bacterium]